MGFAFTSKLPTPAEIREQFPLTPELAEVKHARGEEIRKVSIGESDEFVVITGLYSTDNEGSARDYTERLVRVQERTEDKLIITPRVYTNKPRTTGGGYMGTIHQPDPEGQPGMSGGILAIHHMHMRVSRETSFSTVDEIFYPENMNYLSDMMSYVAVDIRPVGNQPHRLVASGCDTPVGMKDPTSGDLTAMLNSMVAAQLLHDFIFRGFEVQRLDNPLTHIILHEAVNKKGQCTPNYHYEDLRLLSDLHSKRGLQNPACIVGTDHANSNKQYQGRTYIAKEVLHSRRHSGDVRNLIKGLMIENYIESGNQKIGEYYYGESITDPCLGWDDMEWLLYEIVGNPD